MGAAEVRYSKRRDDFSVVGFGSFGFDGTGAACGPIALIGRSSLASLRRAVSAYLAEYPDEMPLRLWLSEVPEEDFVENESPEAAVEFGFAEDALVHAYAALPRDLSLSEAEALVGPHLARNGFALVDSDVISSDEGPQAVILLSFVARRRGLDVQTCFDCGLQVIALVEVVGSREKYSPAVAMDLLRSGNAHLLIDLPESSWFEAKSAPPLVDPSLKNKIDLAQTVASFANSKREALIVVGLRTKKNAHQGDVVQQITPIPLNLLNKRTYRKVLDARIYPAIRGLTVEVLEVEPGKGLLFIHVPCQVEGDYPFLVHGAIVGKQVEGDFISFVIRSGEDTIRRGVHGLHHLLERSWSE